VLLLAVVVVLGGGLCFFVPTTFWHPVHAVDHDPYLTSVAKPAGPLIEVLAKVYAKHHQYPVQISAFGGWRYTREMSDGYRLSRKLGWRGALVYRGNAHDAYWEYDAGDGKTVTRIRLEL
jgi:hypothetical protein